MPVLPCKPQEPLDCRDGSYQTISRTSQSEVAAADRSPIGRDRVAPGCFWILQGPASRNRGREGLDEHDELAAVES
jgi:hypothetical protein